jgi:hypothetical protein
MSLMDMRARSGRFDSRRMAFYSCSYLWIGISIFGRQMEEWERWIGRITNLLYVSYANAYAHAICGSLGPDLLSSDCVQTLSEANGQI